METPDMGLRKPTRKELRECASEVRRRVEVRPIDEVWKGYFGPAELARALVLRGLNPVGVEVYLPLLVQVINSTDTEGHLLKAGKYMIGMPMIHHNGRWDEKIPVKRISGTWAFEQIINGRCSMFTLSPNVKWNNPTAVKDHFEKEEA